jgi:hypothetical protein
LIASLKLPLNSVFAQSFRNLLQGKEIPPVVRTGKVHVSAEVDNPAATIDDYENHNVALNKLGEPLYDGILEWPTARTALLRRWIGLGAVARGDFFGRIFVMFVCRPHADRQRAQHGARRQRSFWNGKGIHVIIS